MRQEFHVFSSFLKPPTNTGWWLFLIHWIWARKWEQHHLSVTDAYNPSPPIYYPCSEGQAHMPSCFLKNFPSLPTSLSIFIINWCWILSNTFSAPTELMLWFLFFMWLIAVCHWLICRCWTFLLTWQRCSRQSRYGSRSSHRGSVINKSN